MAVDTSMYGGAPAVRLLDPYERELRREAVQRNALARQAAQMQMQEAQAARERQAQLRGVLAGGGPDVEEQLLRGGFLTESAAVGRQRRENRRMDLESENARLDREIRVQTRAAQMLQGIRDDLPPAERQARWERALSFMEQMSDNEGDIRTLSQIPRQFDPQIRDILVDATMTAAQKGEAAARARAAQVSEANQLVRVDPTTGEASENPVALRAKATVAAAGAQGQPTPLTWKEVENPDGTKSYVPLPANVPPGRGLPGPVAGGRPSSSATTDDERKAAGWFSQARFAFENISEAMAADPRAAFPTAAERAAKLIPGEVGDDLSNAVQSPQRQRYTQAVSSFSEAALRAATGAGQTKEEAAQKIKELTPRLGDSPAVVTQKQRALEMYLESLQFRANRALPVDQRPGRAPAVRPPTAPPAAPAGAPAAAPRFRVLSVTPQGGTP